MTPETIGALVGLGAFFGMSLIGALIPKGYHFKFMDRFLRKDKEDDDDLAS